MKTRTYFTTLTMVAGLVLAFVIQAAAQAPGGGRGGFGFLNDEQRTKLREAMQASQDQLAPLNEKLAAAQKEALKAAMEKTPDEKTVRAKIEAVHKIQTDIAIIRLKAVKEIGPTLTEEQKTQINERPGMAYNMLLGGFGPMGGRRGGAGGGGGNQ